MKIFRLSMNNPIVSLSTLYAVLSLVAVIYAPNAFTQEHAMSYVGKHLYEFKTAESYDRTIASIAEARDAFFKSLGKQDQAKVLRPALDKEWRKWSNLPPRPDYAGVCLKDISPEQISSFLNLLAESTSAYGFEKIRDIILSDDKLIDLANPPSGVLLGSNWYWVVLFGEPSDNGIWGWQIDGHHLGLNVIINGGELSIAPSFIGTQPSNFSYGKRKNIQPMKTEMDVPYDIIESLNDAQLTKVVVGTRTQNLSAGPGLDKVMPQKKGLAISDLNREQKQMVLELASAWINIMPEKFAKKDFRHVRRHMNSGRFAWRGKTSRKDPVYYSLNMSGFFVEFTHNNLGGDPFAHIHSVYRKIGSDYLSAEIPHD